MVSTRLQSSGSDGEGSSKATRQGNAPQDSPSPQPYVSKTHLLDLPSECLEKILRYLDFKQIAQLREVCKRFNEVGGDVLTSTFLKMQKNLSHRYQNIKSSMPRRESIRRSHSLACECDIIETIHLRLSLLKMSLGKHLERKLICFFAGEILDEVNRLLRYVKTTLKMARPYLVTDELLDLSTMALEYFQEKLEPKMPVILLLDYGHGSPSLSHRCAREEDDDSSSSADLQEDLIAAMRRKNYRGLSKIKREMKRFQQQQAQLRREVRCCKAKMASQQRQLREMVTRTEHGRNLDEINNKFAAVLQELNKRKTELQYWRSRSPGTVVDESCSSMVVPTDNQSNIEASTSEEVLPTSSASAIVDPSSSGEVVSRNCLSHQKRNKRKSSLVSNGPPSAKKRNIFKSRPKRV